MNKIAKTSIIALISALTMGAAALAEPDTAVDPLQPAEPAVTTGSINLDPSFEQRMADCMAIWDKGTHMTKAQWRRTCKTTLREFND
jgi:hypothetical protein